MSLHDNPDLDAPIFGARNIARAAKLFERDEETDQIVLDKHGQPEVDVRKGFYLLETGAIRAKLVKGRHTDEVKGKHKKGDQKSRGQWVTTLRLIRQSLLPGETG